MFRQAPELRILHDLSGLRLQRLGIPILRPTLLLLTETFCLLVWIPHLPRCAERHALPVAKTHDTDLVESLM